LFPAGDVTEVARRSVRQAGWLIFAAGLVIGFGVGWRLWLAPERPGNMTAPAGSRRFPPAAGPQFGVFSGNIAPDIRLPTLDGGTATLGEHLGHRVLVNFFASWCDACRAEMPGVQSQAVKHAMHDWAVLGVEVMETREAALAFRDEFGLTFPILLDDAGLTTRRYQVSGTPTSLFIDREGVIVERRLGYMSEAEIARIIESVP
jgi:peroxiredoxin